MTKRLVLAGGGHAHLHALSRLDAFAAAGIDVVCVAPSPHLAYSGMGPGMLSGRYAPWELRFDIKAMVETKRRCLRRPGGIIPPGPPGPGDKGSGENEASRKFVQGTVCRIDPEAKRLVLRDGREIAYDAVSFGIGSRVEVPFPVEAGPETLVCPVKPIDNLLKARQRIESLAEAGEPVRVLVAGGGTSGFEVAGNVLGLLASCGVKTPLLAVAVGRGLLRGWPLRARRLAIRSLLRRGARILRTRVARLAGDRAILESGESHSCDVLFVATGTRPPDLFAASHLALSPDGGLTVNAFLQSPIFPDVFGGGDCIHFAPGELPRAGVYAVRQGPVLFANLLARLTGRELTPFRQTGRNFLSLLNCGDGQAILCKGLLVFEGRWCMELKDWIDQRFMRSFPPGSPRS